MYIINNILYRGACSLALVNEPRDFYSEFCGTYPILYAGWPPLSPPPPPPCSLITHRFYSPTRDIKYILYEIDFLYYYHCAFNFIWPTIWLTLVCNEPMVARYTNDISWDYMTANSDAVNRTSDLNNGEPTPPIESSFKVINAYVHRMATHIYSS